MARTSERDRGSAVGGKPEKRRSEGGLHRARIRVGRVVRRVTGMGDRSLLESSQQSATGMVEGMATKKYTVTLPEELAEAIRAEVGPGGFSRYVTHAIERQREQDRLGELVDWLETEYGPVTEEELAAAEAERLQIERAHAERARAQQVTEKQIAQTQDSEVAEPGKHRTAA